MKTTLFLLIAAALLLLAMVGGHARGFAVGGKYLYDIQNDLIRAVSGGR